MCDLLVKIILGHFLHLGQDQARNLLRRKIPGFVAVLDIDHRFAVFHCCMSNSVIVRPRSLTTSKTVFSEFSSKVFLAASPTKISLSPNATHDGVQKWPYSLVMISTRW
jgi:hypothetical protein